MKTSSEFPLHLLDAANEVIHIVHVYMEMPDMRFVRTVDIRFTDISHHEIFEILLEVAVNLFTRTWFRIRKFSSVSPGFREIAILSLIRSQLVKDSIRQALAVWINTDPYTISEASARDGVISLGCPLSQYIVINTKQATGLDAWASRLKCPT